MAQFTGGLMLVHDAGEEVRTARDERSCDAYTVLIADDDLFVCQAVACILREARQARVHSARDGDEALAMATGLCPDVIVLDIKMPGLGTDEICRRLRAMPGFQSTPIVILTGMLPDDRLLRELEEHVQEIMTKPPDPRKLVEILDGCRRRARTLPAHGAAAPRLLGSDHDPEPG